MWVMTNFGMFFPSVRPADTVPVGDDRTIQVRARRKEDLDRLRAGYMPSLGPTVYMPKTDYQYRAYCTPREWETASAVIASTINYTKFKPTAVDAELGDLYMDIWNLIYREWGGWGTTGRRGKPKLGNGKGKAAATSTTWEGGLRSFSGERAVTSRYEAFSDYGDYGSADMYAVTSDSSMDTLSPTSLEIILAALADYRITMESRGGSTDGIDEIEEVVSVAYEGATEVAREPYLPEIDWSDADEAVPSRAKRRRGRRKSRKGRLAE